MLKGQWKNRMEWWNTDWSKVKPPVEEKARGRDTGVARRLADADGMPAPEEEYDDEELAEEADVAVAYDAAPVAMAAAPAMPILPAYSRTRPALPLCIPRSRVGRKAGISLFSSKNKSV